MWLPVTRRRYEAVALLRPFTESRNLKVNAQVLSNT